MDQSRIEDIYPLAPLQEGLLFQALLEPDSEAYFIQTAFRFSGPFREDVFKETWRRLCDRRATLRSAFIHEGVERPVQVVLKKRWPEIGFTDLSRLPRDEQAARMEEWKKKDRRRGFDLQKDVLTRIMVFRIAGDVHEFVWSYHHILLDGWCLGILQREFIRIYAAGIKGEDPGLPPPAPYGDYIKWLQNRNQEEAREYWGRRLAGHERTNALPGDAPAREAPADAARGRAPGERWLELEEATANRLRDLAAGLKVTLNTIIQCAWGLLLSRHGG
ncbi:MAG: non-ribosomal peptide synthetase, partial [Desulfobacterales bacterium]|nr:non-ribosomal peptide synthetase [Desulfobacterales bacterium]